MWLRALPTYERMQEDVRTYIELYTLALNFVLLEVVCVRVRVRTFEPSGALFMASYTFIH